jgi:putative transposase
MGRPLRASLGGYVYHVLNRGNGRRTVFFKDGDYEAFERILGEALEHVPGMRLLAYTLMPNHWHLVLWPRRDGELSDFGHWLTLTHTQRWHAHYHDIGTGHLYQVGKGTQLDKTKSDSRIIELRPLSYPPFLPTGEEKMYR